MFQNIYSRLNEINELNKTFTFERFLVHANIMDKETASELTTNARHLNNDNSTFQRGKDYKYCGELQTQRKVIPI